MYQQIEELRSRGGEKVALFLTAANMGGVLAAVLPVFLVTGTAPLPVRAVAIVLAALLGYAVTLEVGGLTLYERTLWAIRGAVRQRMNGGRVTPDMFSGAIVRAPNDRPITIGGPITIVRTVGRHRRRLS